MKSLLDKLKISDVNPGACSGPDGWISDPAGEELISYNPSTGQSLARISQTTPASYEKVASDANGAFMSWRNLPAPKRGLLSGIWRRLSVSSKSHLGT